MDDLTKAVYRGFCLLAAVQTRLEDEDIRATIEHAGYIFEQLVPEEERVDEFPAIVPPMDSEQEAAFLADLRRRANHDKAARDQEKIARAVAMSDEENIERAAESEEELRTRRA